MNRGVSEDISEHKGSQPRADLGKSVPDGGNRWEQARRPGWLEQSEQGECGKR